MKNTVLSLIPLIGLIARAHAQQSPIVYVTQVPPPGVIETVTSIGNNHLPGVSSAPRGGDLMIRYPDGAIRYLTREAGYGTPGQQDQKTGSIAVRDPHIHWSGQRILFSMVVTSDNPQADRWQLFEATGFEAGAAVTITKVPNQPAQFNNVQACYAPDDRIIFVSDRTLDGTLSTYPAIDEKGQGRINTGLWSLDTNSGNLLHLDHSPSGSFDPFVDRYGRVVFTRWDHLQRDEKVLTPGLTAFDYSSESAAATFQPGTYSDTFPESLIANGVENAHQFDLFMPWTVNPDGTDLLTLNHVGRHELSPSALKSRNDSNLENMTPQSLSTQVRVASLMQLSEALTINSMVGTDAIFNGLSAGRVVTFMNTRPGASPSGMRALLTSSSGIIRDPSIMMTGTAGFMVASVADLPPGVSIATATYGGGSVTATPPMDPNFQLPTSNPFTIRISDRPANGSLVPLQFISKLVTSAPDVTVTNYDNGTPRTFTGRLWELQPVEVKSTARPQSAVTKLETPEQEIFLSTGVSPLALKSWLRSRDLAMLTVRNVTQRDAADRQQPINLSVEGGTSTSSPLGGPSYKVKSLQLMQGEYLRGYSADGTTAKPGRRIKATAVSAVTGVTSAPAGLPAGSTPVSADGSAAALVPAKRATSWQLLDHANSPVVRERYWLSFQAGEIRSCTSCHGVNSTDQAGRSVAVNPPEALRTLLQSVKETAPEISASSVFQIWSEATHGVALRAEEDDDADGFSNMMEWGMGSNPVSASDKPLKPLTVALLNAVDDKYAKVTFSRATGQARAVTVLEASTDLTTWRTISSISNAVTTVNPAYAIRRTTVSGGTVEEVELTSGFPTNQTADRYYRLRVTAN